MFNAGKAELRHAKAILPRSAWQLHSNYSKKNAQKQLLSLLKKQDPHNFKVQITSSNDTDANLPSQVKQKSLPSQIEVAFALKEHNQPFYCFDIVFSKR